MVSKTNRDKAWNKASKVRGKNPDLYRRDSKGNELYKPSYGKQGPKSWEIDHKKPKAKGGSDSQRNLQILQTKANRRKSDKY